MLQVPRDGRENKVLPAIGKVSRVRMTHDSNGATEGGANDGFILTINNGFGLRFTNLLDAPANTGQGHRNGGDGLNIVGPENICKGNATPIDGVLHLKTGSIG